MLSVDPARPSPEALLSAVHAESRGKLKIFLGAAPGVGKTFEMLQAAHRRVASGDDVVVGIVETHGRQDTRALLEGLEVLPRKVLPCRGRSIEEMDLDAILRRRPQLVLVDELAHSNAEGSRHPKRHQDVEELLAAGINVHSTLNIQHIESLNDVVARITQVRIRETVPDRVLDTADEVELVDLTPQELIQRLSEGKVYAAAEASHALRHYFKPGNLTALRELALRRTAERVDEQMRQYMRQHAIRGPWAAGERLLVCINESPAAAELVRRAKRIADRLNAPWFAIHVETARSQQLSERERDRLAETLRLAESLGAGTLTLPGSQRIADDVLGHAQDNNITQILVGKTPRPRWFEWLHGSVVHELVKRASGITIQVVAEAEPTSSQAAEMQDADAHAGSGWPGAVRRLLGTPIAAYGHALLLIAAATALGRGLVAIVDIPNISLIYLAAVLWSATRHGLVASMFASIASTLAYNFFFIEPTFTFTVADPSQVLALVFFCIAAVLTSSLTARERSHSLAAREQARITAELYAFSRKLAGIRKLDTLAVVTAAQIAKMLDVDVMLLMPNVTSGALTKTASVPIDSTLDAADLAAATWCGDHRQPTGRGTDTLPGTRHLFLPLPSGLGKASVIGVSRAVPGFDPSPAERRLLDALVDLAAIATERIRLARDVDQSRMQAETERLKASLLTSISHDLRTPLASIIGSMASLRAFGSRYDDATRDELLATAQEEAERLNRYVGNLLDMTRLDAGALVPRREPCDLRDLVGNAARRLRQQLAQHQLKVSIPGSLPLLNLDAVLMEQVFGNLLDNAAKYTPPGSSIEIRASQHRFSIVISVLDDGPGIPEADVQRVFDKFYRVRENSDSSRAGTGLGLAICRGFVEAMDGRIRVQNRNGVPGLEFVIEFSSEVVAESPSLTGGGDRP